MNYFLHENQKRDKKIKTKKNDLKTINPFFKIVK